MTSTIRIDKYLASLGFLSRREAKKVFKSGAIVLNGYEEYDHGFVVKDGDKIAFDDQEIEVRQEVTIMLHKPAGYVSSEVDEGGHLSYKHLLSDCIYAPLLRIAGRLDFDTTGLIVATSDGKLIHRIISPKSGKGKEYIVTCQKEISDRDLIQLERGVQIDEHYLTLPATTVRIDDFSFHLIITEGKFHQIKKMCLAIDNEVVTLHRIRVDNYELGNLKEGEWRYL